MGLGARALSALIAELVLIFVTSTRQVIVLPPNAEECGGSSSVSVMITTRKPGGFKWMREQVLFGVNTCGIANAKLF